MKKMKINSVKEKIEILTRDQLRFVIGGDMEDGCQSHDQECDTGAGLNCCILLHCVVVNGSKKCKFATLAE